MHEIHLLVDSRGSDGGAPYGMWAAFEFVTDLEFYRSELIRTHPGLEPHLYVALGVPYVDTEPDYENIVYVIGDAQAALGAFARESDALDWAEEWYAKNPTGELYGFLVDMDPLPYAKTT